MALPRQANVGKIYAILWYNECKSHHTENYSRHTRVRCYQCGKIGHYACDCPKRMLEEQLLLESDASHSVRESRPLNPNRVQNEADADMRSTQKGHVGQETSAVGSAQQTRKFATTERGKNKYV